MGYAENWFGRLPKRGVKQFKALREDGFTAYQIEVSVPREDKLSGSSIAKTVSVRDFNKVIAYEALAKKNVKAIILLVALSERGLENLISDAFSGQPLDWFAESIIHYSQWTFDEREEVLAGLREDVKALYPWSNYEPDYWDIDLRLDPSNFPPSVQANKIIP
ncbi:hypothetical protein [Nostoc sp.]|uniref:hypothetical protein n=1 Tax=Nostoc sp. TaxID=1180 RepID=UPI002FFC660E